MSETSVGDIPLVVGRALRLIEAHPSVIRVVARPIEGSSTTQATVYIRTELPSSWRAAGMSPSGVRAIEPVDFWFTKHFPINAPLISLRPDFNRSHPHIQPGRTSDPPEPCLVMGSAREIMRMRGIMGLVEQLVDWLDKASTLNLIDPDQGWEPTRRDGVDDYLMVDSSWIAKLPGRETGTGVFPARYGSSKEQQINWVALKATKTTPLRENLSSEWKYNELKEGARAGNTHAIVAWSGKRPDGSPFVADTYRPEDVTTVGELIQRATALGCGGALQSTLQLLQKRLANSNLKNPQPIGIVLLARRPFNVIGTMSPYEICAYVIEVLGGDDLGATSIKPVRTALHRDDLSLELLRAAAGDKMTQPSPWTLLGCGSVGSKIALHLARSGRAPAALIDRGQMQPHNFARHATLPLGTGAEFLFGSDKVGHLASSLESLKQSATTHNVDVVSHSLQKQSIGALMAPGSFALVNTTGSATVRETLALPSVSASRPRIIEACLLGIGSTGLMTMEGESANPSTMDLICEAYRLAHADQNMRKQVFNTEAEAIHIGQGCSALTLPLSDGRLSTFAAPMAEHVSRLQLGGLPAEGEVLLGSLNEEGLNLAWHRLKVFPVQVVTSDQAPSVRISARVDEIIKREVTHRAGSETGGILVGRYSDITNSFHVVDVLPAPPDSKFSAEEFVLGTQGLKPMLRELIGGSGGALYALGTWHNHLVTSGASDKDMHTAVLLAIQQHFPLLMLIYTPGGYTYLTAEVKPDIAPYPTETEEAA